MKLEFLIAVTGLVQIVCAQGITRPFLNRTDINDQAFNSYGTIEGYTSWTRSGWHSFADLDLTLEVIITNSPNAAFDAINNYAVTIFLSQNDTAKDADYIRVTSSGSGSSVRDVVTVSSYTASGAASLNQKVGDRTPQITVGNSGATYRISSTSAVTGSNVNKSQW